MIRPLILIGGGGHCKSVLEVAFSLGRCVKGVLDVADKVGTYVGYAKIIGTDDDIPQYVDECDFLITVGQIKSAAPRMMLARKVRAAGGRFATLVSPRASVSTFAKVVEGTVVMPGACINYGAFVGAHCIVNTLCAIEHDAFINHYCHVSTGAMVNGDCRVGEGAFIGSGAVIANGCSVAEASVVGAGAVVAEDVVVPGTYVGVPARPVSLS